MVGDPHRHDRRAQQGSHAWAYCVTNWDTFSDFCTREVRHKFFTGAHLDPAERKAHLGRRSPNGVVAQQAELTDVFIPWVVDPTSRDEGALSARHPRWTCHPRTDSWPWLCTDDQVGRTRARRRTHGSLVRGRPRLFRSVLDKTLLGQSILPSPLSYRTMDTPLPDPALIEGGVLSLRDGRRIGLPLSGDTSDHPQVWTYTRR